MVTHQGDLMDSILTSIKKLLGITEDYVQFDDDIIIHINTIISMLTQVGVGSDLGFYITDKTAKWSDWLTDMTLLHPVKTYIHLRVRLIFDPPTNSAVTKSYEQTIKELEWRLFTAVDPPLVVEEVITP